MRGLPSPARPLIAGGALAAIEVGLVLLTRRESVLVGGRARALRAAGVQRVAGAVRGDRRAGSVRAFGAAQRGARRWSASCAACAICSFGVAAPAFGLSVLVAEHRPPRARLPARPFAVVCARSAGGVRAGGRSPGCSCARSAAAANRCAGACSACALVGRRGADGGRHATRSRGCTRRSTSACALLVVLAALCASAFLPEPRAQRTGAAGLARRAG